MSSFPDAPGAPGSPAAPDSTEVRGARAGLLLSADLLHRFDTELAADDSAYAAMYPGPPGPGPVHTVYVPVPQFHAAVVEQWRSAALGAIAAQPDEWARVLDGLAVENGGQDPAVLHELTLAKLTDEPIEDLRIDLEDGFRAHRGPMDDEDEDARAIRAAELAGAWPDRPRHWGLRIRSLAGATRHRGLRTLDLFLSRLGSPPGDGFIVTLPKVTSVLQVAVFAEVLALLESAYGCLHFEIQVETPQTILGADGRLPLPEMIRAGGGRVSGLHFGTYDYSASLGILGPYQDLRHPVADAAKDVMLLAAAETGVRVSDGSDNRVPVGPPEVIEQRWARHADGVLRALRSGIYQGWDLHPAQLPTRFAATFAFYRTGFADAAGRLARYHRQDAAGGVLDEPATAFALARHLAAARGCGAVTAAEIAPLDDATLEYYLQRGAVPGGSGRGGGVGGDTEGGRRAPESG